MPTGACGVNCDVCQLNIRGTCSTCGPGGTLAARKKLAAQNMILGAPCPILACADLKKVAYCLRDCDLFPCENVDTDPYPFSQGFLDMQTRRRRHDPPASAPDGSRAEVDPLYWDELVKRDCLELANMTLFTPQGENQLVFRFLNQDTRVDFAARCLKRQEKGRWIKIDDSLLELATVMYLINVRELVPLGREIVGVRDLKEGHFFQGPHVLQLEPLINRYGDDIEGFESNAAALGGEPLDMADTAYRLSPFPRIPLYYLLWRGDDEFRPRAQVLFDRSIEEVMAADAIWGLVNRVTQSILGVK